MLACYRACVLANVCVLACYTGCVADLLLCDSLPHHCLSRRADHLLAILSDDKTVRRKVKVSYGEGHILHSSSLTFVSPPPSLPPSLPPPSIFPSSLPPPSSSSLLLPLPSSLPLLPPSLSFSLPPPSSLSWRDGFCPHCRTSVLWKCAVRGWGTGGCRTHLSW